MPDYLVKRIKSIKIYTNCETLCLIHFADSLAAAIGYSLRIT